MRTINLLKKACTLILVSAITVMANSQSLPNFKKQNTSLKGGQSLLAGNDAALDDVNPSNGNSMWPKVSTDSVAFIGTLRNTGTNYYPGVVVTVEIFNQSNALVYTDSVVYAGMNPGATIAFSVGNYYSIIKGDFTAKAFCTMQGFTDEDATNDTVYAKFQVNDSVMGHDYSVYGDPQDPQTLNDYDTLSKLGNIYQLTKADYLTSVYFELMGAASTSDSIRASIYSVTAGLPDQLIAQSVISNITAAGVPSTYDLAMEGGPLLLQPGFYMVCVNEYGGNINLGSTVRNFQPFTSWIYYHNPADGYDGWYTMETFGASYFRTFVVRPVFGCTLDAQYSVTDEKCNSSNGSVSLSINGASGNISYSWSNGSTGSVISNVIAGNYTCLIADEAGCSQTINATVANIPGPVVNLVSNNPALCYGTSTASAIVGASSGVAPYLYLWSNGFTADSQTGIPSATYTVTVTDNNGCSSSTNFFVDQPALLEATTSFTNVTCNGFNNGTSTVTATGGTQGFTYLWTNGETTSLASNLLPGVNYNVTVTDANSCTATASAIVTEPTSLSYSSTVTNVNCFGESNGSIAVSPAGGVGGYQYVWINGSTTDNVNSLIAGSYAVTITDNNGCSLTTSILVTEPSQMVAAATGNDVSCFGFATGSAASTVTGGVLPYSYLWSNGETADSIFNLLAGTQTVLITDGNGCVASASIAINEPTAVTGNSTTTDLICFNQPTGSISIAALGGTGSYNYLWSNSATTNSINGLLAGPYNITITDGNGCVYTTSFTLTQPLELIATASGSDISCYGLIDGAAWCGTTGGILPYTYLWANGSTQDSVYNIPAGTQTVTVTDGNGCFTLASIALNEPPQILVNATGSDILCYGDSTGTANALPSGGTGAFSYLWSTGSTDQNISGLGVNIYTVTVYDANSCTSTATVNVASPPDLTNILSNTADNGTGNGTATALGAGGVAPYTYSWQTNPVQTTSMATGLTSGIYFVITTDANGCNQTDAVFVPSSAGLNVLNAGVASFTLSPNPATDLITIAIKLVNQSDIKLSLLDARGRLIKTEMFSDKSELNTLVDLTVYDKGIYLLNLQTQSGSISKRIIIQ